MLLYGDLAQWFHLLTAPADYAGEAAYYAEVIDTVSEGGARTLLELGSGGGNNASHLKARYTCTLTDRSSEMLELSRTLNPECEHVEGDMRTLRLGRTFDAVFVHDALMYLRTEDDLSAAVRTAAAHARRGGVVLLVPDAVRETFAPGVRHGGHDDEHGRALRYLEWSHDADPGSSTFETDFALLLREPGGRTHVVHDRHVCGLFSRDTWLHAIRKAGLELVEAHVEHPYPGEFEIFTACRPA